MKSEVHEIIIESENPPVISHAYPRSDMDVKSVYDQIWSSKGATKIRMTFIKLVYDDKGKVVIDKCESKILPIDAPPPSLFSKEEGFKLGSTLKSDG